MKLAYSDLKRYDAGQRFSDVPVKQLISKEYARKRDYRQIIKTYGTEESIEQQRRYGAPKITEVQKRRSSVIPIGTSFRPATLNA